MNTEPIELTADIDDLNPIPISEDLWGVFFEDINHSADGGLYAELVRNRSFSFSERDAPGWGALTGWEVTGDVREPDGQPGVVLDGRAAEAAISNTGYDGISVAAGERYCLQLTGAGLDGAAAVRVVLSSAQDETLAACEVELTPEPGVQHHVLTPVAADLLARLRLSVVGGAVALSLVSLFPEHTFGRPNGLRPDLAEAIAALRPRFVRFPGGCVAHGFGPENLYRWKDTLGPIESRRQDSNIWGYHQSMGIGFYEYFRFCEQIGAKPLPVVAAGVCCQNSPGGQHALPEEEFADYIDDVLDLIEYANGPADSGWGRVRAEAGHPEPFGLEYLGIGNEDEITEQFTDRFERLLRAVKSAHPEISVIGTAGPFPFGRDFERGWDVGRRLRVPIMDEHSYKSPGWYFRNLDRFDGYDRSGPKVYVGEYGSKGNTMLCALAEAAYMIGMERNGDIVRLASYAPLLAKIDNTQWVPDLIYFDNQRVLRTLNYHVQRMHSCSAGDTVLPVELSDAQPWSRLRTSRAGVAVKALTGTLRISAARIGESGPVDLTVSGGDRFVPLQIGTSDADYTLTMRAGLADGRDGFVIAFGDVESGSGADEWHFGTWENRFYSLQRRTDGFLDELVDPVPLRNASEVDIEIRVSGRGSKVECFADGERIHSYTDPGTPEQRISVGAVRRSADGDVFLKAVNATGQVARVDIALASGRPVRGGELVVLQAPPDAGAPFEEAPSEPAKSSHPDLSGGIVLQPYSFTIARLPIGS
ncbi:alpha-L-arabinofuranosidase C-terminal domain-containing protein [Sinomonas sp. G460-2]|uniref:alpha-L-arabinofuranosidase C-terminal domain-containing protein n=1 Tax=Sinomonas sp. G460-2 TaxID=3393464 RepID=UPI0039F07BD3